MFLLHTHESIGEQILHEVFLHGFYDTLSIIPFLFLTYLLMELIEHKASDKTRDFMKRSGKLAPLVGGALGAIPQCGFSSVTANLYCARIVSVGTVIAVFLSTSDEMLPIMISSAVPASVIVFTLLYKALVGIAVGFAIDLILRLMRRGEEEIQIHELCDEEGCHCEGGIFRSALKHTLSISAFLLIITFAINALLLIIGEENLSVIIYDKPFISHLIASIFGLIPNCASSVALTKFYSGGIISLGTMLSGLFSGSGVGLLVLFKMNKKHPRENIVIVLTLVAVGTVFGLIPDLIGVSSMLK